MENICVVQQAAGVLLLIRSYLNFSFLTEQGRSEISRRKTEKFRTGIRETNRNHVYIPWQPLGLACRLAYDYP